MQWFITDQHMNGNFVILMVWHWLQQTVIE